jgi:HAD superfamily hydrolase (TIGR01549 family)
MDPRTKSGLRIVMQMPRNQIPYKDLKTIFLDAGNTLLSMDFSWLMEELKRYGVLCELPELRRSEAAARPMVSAELERLKSTENRVTSLFYMRTILKGLKFTSSITDRELDPIIEGLFKTIKAPGMIQRLWSYILPGVCEAIVSLQRKGLKLVVVSNSNGTVEDILTKVGLRQYFYRIVDSHIVGFEKPDPRLFYHALKISDADPETTLHIGDLYHVDVIGAWSAGLHAALLDPFGDWQNVDCHRFVDLLDFANSF